MYIADNVVNYQTRISIIIRAFPMSAHRRSGHGHDHRLQPQLIVRLLAKKKTRRTSLSLSSDGADGVRGSARAKAT